MLIGIEDVLTETRSETSILRIKCIGEKYLKGQLWSAVGRLYSSPPQTTLFNPSLPFLPIAELISRDSRWLTDAPDISLHYTVLIILWTEISQNMQVCRVIIIRNMHSCAFNTFWCDNQDCTDHVRCLAIGPDWNPEEVCFGQHTSHGSCNWHQKYAEGTSAQILLQCETFPVPRIQQSDFWWAQSTEGGVTDLGL